MLQPCQQTCICSLFLPKWNTKVITQWEKSKSLVIQRWLEGKSILGIRWMNDRINEPVVEKAICTISIVQFLIYWNFKFRRQRAKPFWISSLFSILWSWRDDDATAMFVPQTIGVNEILCHQCLSIKAIVGSCANRESVNKGWSTWKR